MGDTNEKLQMESVAKLVQRILETEYDCEVVMATYALGIDVDGRPQDDLSPNCLTQER